MNEKRATWGNRTDWQTVCRRAAGRNRHNAVRQARAALRRKKLVTLWGEQAQRGASILDRGAQTALAAVLGVHRSTVCRDVAAILADMNERGACPWCGTLKP